MVPAINVVAKESEIKRFYDGLAVDYDAMTGFERRFVQERPFFHMLVEKHGIRSALDAGCGTGFHSLLLAQLGVNVTAVDLSPKMIASVREHAGELGLNVKALAGPFDSLPETLNSSFDAVFSMGNTLAHSSSKEALQRSLKSFGRVLRPGGIIFLQNLNYDRILDAREKVQSVKETDDKTFVRYYDYDDEGVIFNILTIEKKPNSSVQNHSTIRLLPLTRCDLIASLEEAGFTDIRVFGGISMNEYVANSSKDLVLLAKQQ
jgi:ubiquinone/menaquinone biosynthesis C-methylase UbiE